MLKSDQTLEGDNSNQAGRDIQIIHNYYDLDIEKAEKIIEEIFQKRLPYFTEIAEQTARERIKPVAEEIIWKILQQKPEAINEFAEPEVQYMLGSAMKTASSTDDSVVHDTLVRLAVDHVLSEGRSYERIVDEQAIEVLQKMNRDVLRSLQELAFWNTKCEFVTEENIINYITKNAFYFRYRTYLNSTGCSIYSKEPLNIPAKDWFSQQWSVQACRIYEIYGMYFHSKPSKIKEISNDILHKEIDEDFFYSTMKQTCCNLSGLRSTWDNDFRSAIFDYVHPERNLSDLTLYSKNFIPICDFFSKVFYSAREIQDIIQNEDPISYVNIDIFNYELTPVGYALQKYLPPLLKEKMSF